MKVADSRINDNICNRYYLTGILAIATVRKSGSAVYDFFRSAPPSNTDLYVSRQQSTEGVEQVLYMLAWFTSVGTSA